MFFVLSKLIGFLASPFWWILTVLAVAYFIRNRKYKKKLYVFALILFLFFTNPLMFRLAAGLWEGNLQAPESVRNKTDVCVVLGGMSAYDEATGRIRFTQSADRILQAIDLYEKGIISKFVISGGTARLIRKTRPESIHLRDFLVSLGIPSTSVLIDSLSRNTHENSINSMQLVRKNGWSEKIILITSAFHMKRAEGCFKKAGFTVYPYAADPLKSVSKMAISEIVIPSVGVLNSWYLLTHEWAGLVMYRIKGYM